MPLEMAFVTYCNRSNLADYHGKCFAWHRCRFHNNKKVAVVGEDGTLLYSSTATTMAAHLKTAIVPSRRLRIFSLQMPKSFVHVQQGYGEALMNSAFVLDEGEVETVAHYYAAAFFEPDVGLYPRHRRTGYEVYQDSQ